jgi:hypothetical protein
LLVQYANATACEKLVLLIQVSGEIEIQQTLMYLIRNVQRNLKIKLYFYFE